MHRILKKIYQTFILQIVDLYAHGYDANAEDLLKNVTEDEFIGRMLLEIAGRRLNLYTENSQNSFLKVASIGQQLLSYLDNLVSVAEIYYPSNIK